MAVTLKKFPTIFVAFLFVSAAIASLPPPPTDPFLYAPRQAMFPWTTNPNRNLKKSTPKSVIGLSIFAGLALFAICLGVVYCVCFKSSSPPLAATDIDADGTAVGVPVPMQRLRSRSDQSSNEV
ncbi:uncharacterized protein LOC131599474 [Vicia villosa]|uniref:uncharacterized protein LOC131599474 n=1 Tax=Vicia villosa TaxID=3911 RepID=UPI00273CA44C|nr:uncharacterized protein LOC131599474 [Vicia villosa]